MSREAPPDVPVFLDRLTDRFDYAVVGPTDGRRPVRDTRQPPFAAVCHLERSIGGRCVGCTGFLIRPDLVLTAGHCVYSPVRKLLGGPASPVDIRVSPGRDGAKRPFGVARAARWWAHRDYVARARPTCDVGLIRLSEPVAGVAPLRLHAAGDAELDRMRQVRLVHVSGYPADKAKGSPWTHEERLDRHTPEALFYSVDTCPGHSGAPAWVRRWPAHGDTVIGIHVAGPKASPQGAWGCKPGAPLAPSGSVNRAVRLTPRLLEAIEAVAADRPSALFRIVGAAMH